MHMQKPMHMHMHVHMHMHMAGGVIYVGASHTVLHLLHIDDVIDAFAVHGACGLWSLVAVGLAAEGSTVGTPQSRGFLLTRGDARLLGAGVSRLHTC